MRSEDEESAPQVVYGGTLTTPTPESTPSIFWTQKQVETVSSGGTETRVVPRKHQSQRRKHFTLNTDKMEESSIRMLLSWGRVQLTPIPIFSRNLFSHEIPYPPPDPWDSKQEQGVRVRERRRRERLSTVLSLCRPRLRPSGGPYLSPDRPLPCPFSLLSPPSPRPRGDDSSARE